MIAYVVRVLTGRGYINHLSIYHTSQSWCHRPASTMLTPERVTTPPRDSGTPGVHVRALGVIPRGATTGPYPEELRLGLGLTDRREWQAVIEVCHFY